MFACARPGGPVSGARRAARPQKPRRGGRRSTGCVSTQSFCMNCSFTDLAIIFFVILVRLKKSRRPRLRARGCNGVTQNICEARARADMSRTLLCRCYSSYRVRPRTACTQKCERLVLFFFEHCYCERARGECSRAMGRLEAAFLSCRVCSQLSRRCTRLLRLVDVDL